MQSSVSNWRGMNVAGNDSMMRSEAATPAAKIISSLATPCCHPTSGRLTASLFERTVVSDRFLLTQFGFQALDGSFILFGLTHHAIH